MAARVAPWGLLVGVAVVVCAVLIAGCPSKGTVTSPPTNATGPGGAPGKLAGGPSGGGGGDVIKIGAIFSVTGNMAPLGEPEKQAAEMIADEVNAKGGVAGKKGVGLYGESEYGTSYAIYELLHRLGCRWIMPTD